MKIKLGVWLPKQYRIENNSIKKELVYIKKKYFPLKLYFFLCTKKIIGKRENS